MTAGKVQRVAIIGAGHNGLVCAAYLARFGFSVTVYEKRSVVGGLCVTEQLFDGYKVSSVASYYGMLRREIVADLNLEAHGLQSYVTNPAEIILLPGGQYVFTPRDAGSQIELRDLTDSDLNGWQQFWTDIGEAANVIYPFYFKPETDQASVQKALMTAGLKKIAHAIFSQSLLDLASTYFNNRSLLAAAATCTPGFANNIGTVFGCIHHGTAYTSGHQGAWGLAKGGMGAITQSLLKAAKGAGANVVTSASVVRLNTAANEVDSIEFADGSSHKYDLVISSADLTTTFRQLVGDSHLSDHAGKSAPLSAGKAHFALKGLPPFTVLDQLSASYEGIIVSTPAIDELLESAQRMLEGGMPSQPMMTLVFPSVSDPACAPTGHHLLTVDLHHLPTDCAGGWTDSNKSILLNNILRTLSAHSPNLENYIEATEILTPDVLKQRYNLASGSCWHLPMTPEFLFEKRRLAGCEPYRTPIKNLFLCGAGTYGGGNVTGVPGYNCAHVIAKMCGERSLAHAGAAK